MAGPIPCGIIREDAAASALAQGLGVKTETVRSGYLQTLESRGYVFQVGGVHGKALIRGLMLEDAERIGTKEN